MGVKTLADGNTAFVVLPTRPANIDAIKVTEAAAGTDYSGSILASDFDLGPTGSDTIDEKALDSRGNAQVFGLSNYGGGFSVFRYFDETDKQPDAIDDALWEACKTKGSTLYILVRDSAKLAAAPFTAGDEYRYFEIITDDPVRGDRTGYIKYRINNAVQYAALDKVIVAGP